jgi:hypothetical protein
VKYVTFPVRILYTELLDSLLKLFQLKKVNDIPSYLKQTFGLHNGQFAAQGFGRNAYQ